MSADDEIFVGGHLDLDVLHAAIQSADSQLTHSTSSRDPKTWLFYGERVKGEIFQHEYENDGTLDFESYPWVIEIRGLNSGVSAKANQRDFGQTLLRLLKEVGEYKLLYSHDLQVELDRFEPPAIG